MIDHTYIADGHHRTAAAYNLGKKRRQRAIEKGINISGEEDFNYFMAIHYPSRRLKIMDYNRVIKSLNGLSSEEFLNKLSESYNIRKRSAEEDPTPTKKYESSLLLDK